MRKDGRRHAAILCGPGRNLSDMLEHDPHLAPFLRVPGKDNGFDIEGIAVIGERVFVGLRGPVLRGWAVILEIHPEPDPHDDTRLRFAPVGDARYRTHFIDLEGLGIRDLCPVGEEILILAGPTMTHDGPVKIVRWTPGHGFSDPPIHVADLQTGVRDDRPEGPGAAEQRAADDRPRQPLTPAPHAGGRLGRCADGLGVAQRPRLAGR